MPETLRRAAFDLAGEAPYDGYSVVGLSHRIDIVSQASRRADVAVSMRNPYAREIVAIYRNEILRRNAEMRAKQRAEATTLTSLAEAYDALG